MIKRVSLIVPPNDKIVMRDMYSSTISKGSYCWPNVDLMCLSGFLKNEFQTQIIDANAERLDENQTLTRLINFQPDAVIFALGESVKDTDLEFARSVKADKRLSVSNMVGVGGTLLHNSAMELENNLFCDAILKSYVTDDIVKYFKNDFSDLKNMVCRIDNKIVDFQTKYPTNGFDVPIGLHEDLNQKFYNLPHASRGPVTSIATAYGCPHTCSFCVSSRVSYRYRSVESIIAELLHVVELGFKTVFFRDNVFGLNKKHIRGVCEAIIDHNLDIEWVTDTRIDLVDKELLPLMRASGCRALHFGIESVSEDTLIKVRKKLETNLVHDIISACEEADINTVGYFILGLPGETKTDVLATINYAKTLPLTYASFNMPIPIIGTDMRDDAVKSGLIDDSARQYDGSIASPLCSENLAQKELTHYRDMAYRQFYFRPSFVYKFLKRIRSWSQILVGLKEFTLLLNRKGN